MKTKRRPWELGQDLVEFAITFPIFMLIIMAFFDLGRGVYSYSALQNATREAARYAIVHPCVADGNLLSIIRSRALAVDPTAIYFDYFDPIPPVVWDDETVQISSKLAYRAMSPLISAFLPTVGGEKKIVFTSSSTMQRETWASPDCAP